MTRTHEDRHVPVTAYDDWARLHLHLTHRCQLDCVYCDLDRDKPDLDEATIARALELCFASERRKVDIQFFGGEPLLRFDLIRFATERAEDLAARRGAQLGLNLATNGLLLDDARARFVAEHHVAVVFSVDGRPHLQARNRPLFRTRVGPSQAPYPMQRILDGYQRLRGYGVEPMLNVVVGPDDVAELAEGVAFVVEELGATELRLSYRVGVAWPEAAKATYITTFGRMLDRYRGRARFLNLSAGDEPVLAATNVNLDSDGRLYLGCALTTTVDMPSLLATNLVGDLATIDRWDAIDRDRDHQYQNLVSSPLLQPVDRDIIRNNLELGLAVDDFLRRYADIHRESLAGARVGPADGVELWTPRSPGEIAACLPAPDPARLLAARHAAVPGAIVYPFGVDAAEVRLLGGIAPAAVLELSPDSGAHAAARLRSRGFHLAPVLGDGGRLAASRDPSAARRLAEVVAELSASDRSPDGLAEHARLLGAPDCCVAASRARAALPTRLDQAREALWRVAPGATPSPLLNVVDPALLQLVPWLPCAFDCAASAAMAARTLAVVRRVAPGFARRIEAELSAHRVVFHDLAQISATGTWDGERLVVERVWPTSRSHHPDSPAPEDALDTVARLTALVEAARVVRFDGARVLLGERALGGVTATLFPFGGVTADRARPRAR